MAGAGILWTPTVQMSGPWIRRPKCSVQLGFHQNPETWPLPVLWVLTHWGRGSEWEHLKRQHWREREGPEVTLFDLAWEVTQHHFCHILGDCESLGLSQHQRQESQAASVDGGAARSRHTRRCGRGNTLFTFGNHGLRNTLRQDLSLCPGVLPGCVCHLHLHQELHVRVTENTEHERLQSVVMTPM